VDRQQRESYGVVEFLIWPLLFAGLVFAAGWSARRSGIDVPDNVTGTILYAGLAAWILYRGPQAPYGVDVGAVTGPVKSRSDWKLLPIVIPLIAVTGGALYLVTFTMSFIVPQTVAEALAQPDPDVAEVTLRSLPGDLVESAIGAVAEEWLFRGVLLHLWARRFGLRFAVLATSVLFAALHADVIGSFVFGIVMAALYVRTGTLLVPIIAHLAFNAIIAVGSIVLGEGGTTTLAEFRQEWWKGVVGLAGGLAVIVAVVRRIAPWPWRLGAGGVVSRRPS
jgi:membrane protease YdiL (CAAX protease family)